MNGFVVDTLETINERYPYEFYRFNNPKTISTVWDDVYLTELVMPKFDSFKEIPRFYIVYFKKAPHFREG